MVMDWFGMFIEIVFLVWVQYLAIGLVFTSLKRYERKQRQSYQNVNWAYEVFRRYRAIKEKA